MSKQHLRPPGVLPISLSKTEENLPGRPRDFNEKSWDAPYIFTAAIRVRSVSFVTLRKSSYQREVTLSTLPSLCKPRVDSRMLNSVC